MKQFDFEFFDKIFDVVIRMPSRKAETVYGCLQPTIEASDSDIAKFEALLKKVESSDSTHVEAKERLCKWLKESICDMKVKNAARALSLEWEKSRQQWTNYK